MIPRSFLSAYILALSLLSIIRAAPILEEDSAKRSPFLNGACQAPKGYAADPLYGCPRNTVFVSQNHPAANYRTINSALSHLPDDGSLRTILIDEGIYHEKVIVGRVSPTVFAGVTQDNRNPSVNRVQIWQSSYINQSDPYNTLSNCDAVTLSVGTGAVHGPSDFKAYNINFVQRQFYQGEEITQYQLGPSAALCVQGANASFYGCGFSSYQDTLFVGTDANAYFFKTTVKGMTDYLYGSGKAWFEQAQLLNRACGGGITAWRGDPDDARVGVYVSNSVIDKSPDASTLNKMEGKCHLSRPWNVYSNSVYLNTRIGSIIADAGFRVWNDKESRFQQGVTRFREYASSGEGGNMEVRDLRLERILSEKEASYYTHKNVFGSTGWIDQDAVKNW